MIDLVPPAPSFPRNYIFGPDGEPMQTDMMTWARWFETGDRHVAESHIGPFFISTVFLGLDHAFPGGPSEPILWETMVFGPRRVTSHMLRSKRVFYESEHQERYTSADDAFAGHLKAEDMAAPFGMRWDHHRAETFAWLKERALRVHYGRRARRQWAHAITHLHKRTPVGLIINRKIGERYAMRFSFPGDCRAVQAG